MLLQFVVALLLTIHPAPASSSFAPNSFTQTIALLQSARIQSDADHEVSARAEAARIQTDVDAESAARTAVVAAAEAQRTVVNARIATPATEAARVAQQPARVQAASNPPGVYLGEALRAALAQTSWPASMWATIERIVRCESGGHTTAVSPDGYVGLMQIAPWFHGYPPSDAVGQLEQAYGVYLQQGWGAWSCA